MSLITPPTRAALWGAAALMSCTLAPQAQAADTTTATLGLGMGVTPRFMGADRYRALVLPMFSIQRGVLFADSTRGLGVQFQSDSGFAASAAIN